MPCAEWCTSVDSRRLSTVESKSKAFLAVDSGACGRARHGLAVELTVKTLLSHLATRKFKNFRRFFTDVKCSCRALGCTALLLQASLPLMAPMPPGRKVKASFAS
eukprot:7044693-Pyramimonas_sp.AAC.1